MYEGSETSRSRPLLISKSGTGMGVDMTTQVMTDRHQIAVNSQTECKFRDPLEAILESRPGRWMTLKVERTPTC